MSQERVRRRGARRRRPHVLAFVAFGYLAWSLIPLLIAVLFSFNAGQSISVWQGFSLQWWIGDSPLSLLHNSQLHLAIVQSLRLAGLTLLIAVPAGTAFAIAVDRWRGGGPAAASYTMLFAFVIPEIVLAVGLFLTFGFLLREVVHLGTFAQVLGLSVYRMPYAYILVRASLLATGRSYEEAAMDLGSTRTDAIRRVLLRMVAPAMFASGILIFAGTLDDFVMVNYLSAGAATQPLSVVIYGVARNGPPPSVNAAGAFMLVTTAVLAAVALWAYRLFGQRGPTVMSAFERRV